MSKWTVRAARKAMKKWLSAVDPSGESEKRPPASAPYCRAPKSKGKYERPRPKNLSTIHLSGHKNCVIFCGAVRRSRVLMCLMVGFRSAKATRYRVAKADKPGQYPRPKPFDFAPAISDDARFGQESAAAGEILAGTNFSSPGQV
jgi:hypothetical protein